MKKILLHLIIFITLFVGTATCVVVNGYSNYQKELENTPVTEVTQENTALTSLATNVLNSESYSGTLELTDNQNTKIATGSFSYLNTDSISAEISLSGEINNFNFDTDIILLNDQLFLEFNGLKFNLNTTDMMTAINSVIASINSGSDSDITEIDTSSLTSLLSDITTTPFGSGFVINANIPNLCSVYIVTDSEYIPTQILVSNIKINEKIYSLTIQASQDKKEILVSNPEEYLNATPALNYISPVINTINQGDLSLSGTINLSGIEIGLRAFYNSATNKILGYVNYGELKVDYIYDGEFIAINLYGNVYKLTLSDIESLLTTLTGEDSQISIDFSNLSQLIDKIEINPTIKNDVITNCIISYDSMTLDLEIGKTLYMPKPFDYSNAKSATSLKNLITSYENILSNEYSVDISVSTEALTISGKAYILFDNDFKNISSLAFEGKIQDLGSSIVYTSTETFIKVGENKIKLQNANLVKVISTLAEIINTDTSSITSALNLDLSLLNNLTLNGKTISFSKDNINLNIVSYQTSYKLSGNINGLNLTANIVPNSPSYKYIATKLNPQEFKAYDSATTLVNALKNTLNQDSINFSGNINIKVLDWTYKNIGVDILFCKNSEKLELTLSNLPCDAIVTYLNNLCFKNQTSKITIQNNTVTIYTTAINRITGKTIILANKTMPIDEFSLNNLYDICSMRKSIINKLNSGSSQEFSSNITTDCIDILDESTKIDLTTLAPQLFNELNAEFNYSDKITSASLYCKVENALSISVNLNSK